MGKSSGLAEKSKNRLRKHQEKHTSEREKAKDDATVEISVNTVLDLRPGESERANPPLVSGAETSALADANSDEDSDANSEVEEQERRLTEKKKKGKGKAKGQTAVKPFAQRDLVSLAFAGDKVVQVCFSPTRCVEVDALYQIVRTQDFQEAKQREILEDAPKEVNTTLPGWVNSFLYSTALSTSSHYGLSRVRGVGTVQEKHHRNRSSSRGSPASTHNPEKTTEKLTSSSLRDRKSVV